MMGKSLNTVIVIIALAFAIFALVYIGPAEIAEWFNNYLGEFPNEGRLLDI